MTDTSRRRSLLRPPYRRRLLGCLAFALAVGVAAWYFGVDVGHAVGLGAVVLAFAACVGLVGDQPRVDWAPEHPAPRDGSRREIVQLGWALHARGGGVAPEAVRRLRTLTAQALELHGLDLDDAADRPEIERAVGADVLRIIRRGTAELPRLATYQSVLGVLDGLADARPGRLGTPDRRPTEEDTHAR